MIKVFIFFFFFSSRRRHTRFDCDWSSDVCSSDLQYCRSPSKTLRTSERLRSAMGVSELTTTATSAPREVCAADGEWRVTTAQRIVQKNITTRLLVAFMIWLV